MGKEQGYLLDRKSFACFRLGRLIEDKSLFGFVEKGNELHQRLTEVLDQAGFGGGVTIPVEIRQPAHAVSLCQVAISSLAAPSRMVS